MERNKLSTRGVSLLVRGLAERMKGATRDIRAIYGIPRGGVPVALALEAYGFTVVDNPALADACVDDIIDSGKTAQRFLNQFGLRTYALIDRLDPDASLLAKSWVVFPWEVGLDGAKDTSAEDVGVRLLQYIGEDPTRGGLKETPARFLRAWGEWCSGYGKNPADVLKTFEDGAENYDQMIVVQDIPFYSHCEHHLAPFFGTATVGYIPDKRIVGLSKLSRVVDIFARRLQVQERLTVQVVDALNEALAPKGVGVLLKARHLCMESRGICKSGHTTETSALRGLLLEKDAAKAEFLALAHR